MSMFLPENFSQADTQTGVASIAPATPEVTQGDITLMQRVLTAAAKSPNLIPSDFMAYMFDWIQTQRLQIPISQVFGFTQFAAQSDFVSANEKTSSTTYTDLSTVGPTLGGLSDGKYVLIFGAAHAISATPAAARMAVQANSATPVDDDSTEAVTDSLISCSRATVASVVNGNSNTFTAKYKATSGTAAFESRWLVALKFANN